MNVYLWAMYDKEIFLYYGMISEKREKIRWYDRSEPRRFRKFRGARPDDPDANVFITVGPNEGEVYKQYVWFQELDFEKAKAAFIEWQNEKIRSLITEIDIRKQKIVDISNTETYCTC